MFNHNYRTVALCSVLLLLGLQGRAALTASFAQIPISNSVDLSTFGPVDWVHWGTFTEFMPERKANVAQQISDYAAIGTTGYGPYQYNDNYCGFSWFDGFPTSRVTNTTTGVYRTGRANGFQFTVNSDTRTRILRVYVGAFAAKATFSATLSDGGSYSSSALDYSGNGPAGLYTLTYSSASTNQKLTVKITVNTMYDKTVGNVTLQAAALSYPSNNPPIVELIEPAEDFITQGPTNLVLRATAAVLDGAVTNIQLFSGTNLLRTGLATNEPFTWTNVAPGNYAIWARASASNGLSQSTLPRAIYIHSGGTGVTSSVSIAPSNVVLSAEGTHDWAHWGTVTSSSYDHKAGVTEGIGDFIAIGNGTIERHTDNRTAVAWSGGTPTATITNSATDVTALGFTNGFELSLPADTNPRTLRLYVGANAAEGRLEVSLSDFSSPPVVDHSARNTYNPVFRTYIVSYRAAGPGQTLRIRYTASGLYDSVYGGVKLSSATLTGDAPLVAITSPTEETDLVAPSTFPIHADAFDLDGTVLLVEFFANQTKIGEAVPPSFSMTWSNVPKGDYTLVAKATDDAGSVTFSAPVAIHVVTNRPPTVAFATPSTDASFVDSQPISVTLSASDLDGQISRADLFLNGSLVRTWTNAPFTTTLTNVAVGNHELTAVAYDNRGATSDLALVTIHVTSNQPPLITWLAPEPGASWSTLQPVTLSVDAGDPDGVIQRVDFFVNTAFIASVSNFPYQVIWSNSPPGQYQLSARAYDAFGASVATEPALVTRTNLPPSVTITATTNTALIAPAAFTISASGQDADGHIVLLELIEGTNVIGSTTNSSISTLLTNRAAGAYSFSARAMDDRGSPAFSATVSVTVVTNTLPQVAILTPTNGSSHIEPASIPIVVSASDMDGMISVLELYDGTNLLASAATQSMYFTWQAPAPGSHLLSARAADDRGGVAWSETNVVNILSNQRPAIALVAPTNNESFIEPTLLTLLANASDPDGSIALVEFYSGTNLLGSATNPPFACSWSNPPIGLVTLQARAVDDRGAAVWSEVVTLVIVTNEWPTVEITAPTNDASLIEPATVGVVVSAHDPDGLVTSVEIYDGTNLLAVVTNAPFTVPWSQPTLGTHLLSARAFDERGAASWSPAVSVSILSNQPPEVAIISPTNSATFIAPSQIVIDATAADLDGLISRVEIFANSNLLASVTNLPFSAAWTNPPPGEHTLTARAWDERGAISESTPVLVIVEQPNESSPVPLLRVEPVTVEGFHFSFETDPAWNYLIETSAISPIVWSPWTNAAGSGQRASFVSALTNHASLMFRVTTVPTNSPSPPQIRTDPP